MGLSMSEPLYLILHKVRGEPAFDIATPLEIGDEEGWIIPTSGHRAYPAQIWPLDDLVSEANASLDNVPDHYAIVREPSPGRLKELLGIIGLGKPSVKAVRGLR